MKFSISTTELQESVSIVSRAAARSTNPSMEGILFKVHDSVLTLISQNAEIAITDSRLAIVEEEGSCVVPAKLLGDLVRRLPECAAKISVSSSYQMRISAGGSRTTIACRSAELFPDIPEVGKGKTILLPQKIVKSMIEKTSFAVSTDMNRPILMGGLFEADNNRLNFVTVDGFRMGYIKNNINYEDEKIDAIIPGKSMDEIAKLLSDDEDKPFAEFIFGEKEMSVRIGSVTLYSTLISGKYIDYNAIIPKNSTTEIVVKRQELSECVERAGLMAQMNKNKLVIFNIGEDGLKITSTSDSGDAEEICTCLEKSGNDLTIAFNVMYLTNIMRVIETDTIKLKLGSAVQPCVIVPDRDTDTDSYLYLVLPVRISA